MKKLAFLMAVVMAWLCIFSGAMPVKQTPAVTPTAVDEADDSALEIRLCHMLNLNRVYDGDLSDPATLLEEAAAALLDRAVQDENGFCYIENGILESFVYNLYGVGVPAATLSYGGFAAKEGYTLILPRGSVDFTHTIVEIYEKEGGILRVVSCVEINPHDGEPQKAICNTRFAPSAYSAFGWVITSAEIL